MLTKIRKIRSEIRSGNGIVLYGIAWAAILVIITILLGIAIAATAASQPGSAPKATCQSTPGPGNPYGGGGYRPPASR